ncbi:MAG: hypothetical protein ACLSHU_12515 [Oscillospiraceae bacterium]
MKTTFTRKALALLLAVCMVLSLGSTALAAQEQSIPFRQVEADVPPGSGGRCGSIPRIRPMHLPTWFGSPSSWRTAPAWSRWRRPAACPLPP